MDQGEGGSFLEGDDESESESDFQRSDKLWLYSSRQDSARWELDKARGLADIIDSLPGT